MTFQQIFLAALRSVREMGADLKGVSWFKRNWNQVEKAEETKKAA